MRKESDAETFNCIICKDDRAYYSIGVCEHRKVCNHCSLRSRILYKDRKCPICTTKLDHVYIFENIEKPSFLEMERNKEYYYQDDDYEENGVYYSTVSAKEEALMLKSFLCPIKSCQEGAFDNLQTLCTHLNKVHKRYFCETCLKEGKKFLSEMPIYTYDTLNEHITYGEYSEKGTLIIPPHSLCTYCNIKFYNDEFLFKHMNEQHFICQLCKDKKNIIFYKEISQLLDHYQFMHFVCPYQECLEDMFVVFDTEEKLNSHLLTKHKCMDAQHKLTSFHLADKKKIDYGNKYKPARCEEFNFTSYVNELKERVKTYMKNFNEVSRYSKVEDYSGQDNNYNNSKNYSQKYSQNYSQNEEYNNTNAGKDRSTGGGFYNENSYYGSNSSSSNKKRGGRNNAQNAHNGQTSYNNDSYNINSQAFVGETQNQNGYYQEDSFQRQNKRGGGRNKNSNDRQDYQPAQGQARQGGKPQYQQLDFTPKVPVKIDYSFIFNGFSKIIKEYLGKKIKTELPKEEEFIIPSETIYQLIIIIDRLENDKLLELTSLTNFGIDLEVYRELRKLVGEGNMNETILYRLFDQLDIRIILLVYKYFVTAAKKIDGLFYKLELEQIEPDMYDDFAIREKKYKKVQYVNVHQQARAPKKEFQMPSRPKIIEKKMKINKEHFPALIGIKNEAKENKKIETPKLNTLFEKKTTNNPTLNTTSITNTTTQSFASTENQIKYDSSKNFEKPGDQNKLTLFFDNKLQPPPKKENKPIENWDKKKKKKINYDDDFPEL